MVEPDLPDLNTQGMLPTSEETQLALLKLLTATAGPALKADDESKPIEDQIDLCIERTKAEASEGAALVAQCAPHGRAVLTQAQKRLETLEALKVMESIASEMRHALAEQIGVTAEVADTQPKPPLL